MSVPEYKKYCFVKIMNWISDHCSSGCSLMTQHLNGPVTARYFLPSLLPLIIHALETQCTLPSAVVVLLLWTICELCLANWSDLNKKVKIDTKFKKRNQRQQARLVAQSNLYCIHANNPHQSIWKVVHLACKK